MAADKFMEAMEPFSVDLPSGAVVIVSKGDLFYVDDEVVKGRRHLFGEVTVRRSAPPKHGSSTKSAAGDSETADATPGTRRARTSREGGADA